MKKFFLTGLLITTTFFVYAQKIDAIINGKEAERIVSTLADDDMKGRRAGSEGNFKAAKFIGKEFEAIGLKFFQGLKNYYQPFTIMRPKQIELKAIWDKKEMDASKVVVVTTLEDFIADHKSGFEFVFIKPGANLIRQGSTLVKEAKNYIVLVDESFEKEFSRLASLKRQLFAMNTSAIFILANKIPDSFSFQAKHEFQKTPMGNVVGVLPGKKRPEEFVIYSAHFDHIGIGKPVEGDSIYNGANDNASGTTAVILLAKYFKAMNNNDRTLVFVAFDAEEIGGYGSQYFSRQFADPKKIAAMFNIEMIGTESKWGEHAAFITGYDKTDMGAILQKNLAGSDFTFHPDPYPDQNLYYRSDNATLARLGVPAHTISTAKMDNEPNYHRVSDEIKTMAIQNLTSIIKSIALSSVSIISGKDTPSRVKVEELR